MEPRTWKRCADQRLRLRLRLRLRRAHNNPAEQTASNVKAYLSLGTTRSATGSPACSRLLMMSAAWSRSSSDAHVGPSDTEFAEPNMAAGGCGGIA